MKSERRLDFALLLLLALLAAQLALTVAYYHHPLVTDEFYWTKNARYLVEHGRFPPIHPAALAAGKGQAWGTADYRPQGFTVFAALCSLGDFAQPATTFRLRVTVAQFVLLAAILVWLYRIAVRAAVSRWTAALLLGVTPWTFEFVNDIGADSLNAIVVSLALLLLWRWIAEPGRGAAAMFWASLAASVPLLIRPEMIVLAPCIIGLAVLLRWPPSARELVAALSAFVIVTAAQVAYRTRLTGEPGIYGKLHIVNMGAFQWANTWPGTEKEGYDFVYLLTEGKAVPLPARAFGDDNERARVERIVHRVAASGRYTQQDDAEFEQLAQERRRGHPFLVASLRLWHAAHLWLNNENPNPILVALAPVPRTVRRPIYGSLLLLRLVLYALACLATVRAFRRWRAGKADAFDRLTLLMASFILARTVLIGPILNWKVHRYVLAAWPAMLWCACAALRPRLEAGE